MNDLIKTGVEGALEAVRDPKLPIEKRAVSYAILRRVRLEIDRAIRPVGHEIQAAMAAAKAREWGPIRLTWKAVDPHYVCNDPDNWGDDGVQETLAVWHADTRYSDPDGTRWVTHIPDHFEVDTAALGKAIASGDPAARELYDAIKERGYRTEVARAATLTVVEPPKEKAA